jgi:hypothetical protein
VCVCACADVCVCFVVVVVVCTGVHHFEAGILELFEIKGGVI